MAEAMNNYAVYRAGAHAWMLGRFVIPVSRLSEFDSHSPGLLTPGQESAPWLLAALAGVDLEGDMQHALKFNCRHWQGSELGHAVIDTIELRAGEQADPARTRAAIPDFFTLYVESGTAGRPASVLDFARLAGARAKIRTGGVTSDVFPAPDDVLTFIAGCAERGLAFKATAGLHHLIRSEYPLTYESGSGRTTMYGFLNVFLAATALFSGGSAGEARGILLESDLSSFRFDEDGILWRNRALSAADVTRAREFATSFGSCSFREPVDELMTAGLVR